MATENRYIRIEDWQGNTYLPITETGNSTAGSIADASKASTNPSEKELGTYTDGTITTDPDANYGKVIWIDSPASASTKKVIYSTCFSNLSFGPISIMARLKVANMPSSNVDLIEINIYSVDASGSEPVFHDLETITVDKNSIQIENEFVTIGKVLEYTGETTGANLFKVELLILGGQGHRVAFDYLAVAMALPTIGNVIDVQKIEGKNTLIIT